MKILALGEVLERIGIEDLAGEERPLVFLTDFRHAKEAMEMSEMSFDGEISMESVSFCRFENQQECMAGTLSIPKLLDVLGSRYKLMMFVNCRTIVIIDDQDFAERVVFRIQRKTARQGRTREQFLYNFVAQFMSRDMELLGQYERLLMSMEEDVMNGKIQNFQNKISPIRRELLVLRGYYDELMDMGRTLEENENDLFEENQLKYFGTIADRADRLMSKTAHLLEYAQQVRDAYQAQVDAAQNQNMQFLTVVSTIFFPLTLITGWYGMNFENMPELENGYPGVLALSLAILILCILFFKKKKML